MAMCFCAAGRELERLTARPRSRAWGLRGQTPALLLGAGRGPAKFPTWMLRHAADASFVRQEDAHLECSAACDTACVRMLLPAIAIQAESDLRGLDAGSLYGFPSKLAALQVRAAVLPQFEWSWQTPHLSRHLRVVHGQQRAVYAGRSAEPLFPASRKSYGTSRKGERRVKLRSTNVPEHKFLVLRALLSSEPFCHWGLRVAFFTEYAYGVWRFLERTSPTPKWHTSRVTRRALPPGYPAVLCDFRGVLGAHSPLQRTATSEAMPPLPEAATRSAQQRTGRASDTVWDECPPPARDAKTLGLTWDALERAPQETQPWLALHRASQAEATQEADQVASHADRAALSCGLCRAPIDLARPLSYTLCPIGPEPASPAAHGPPLLPTDHSFVPRVP
ncbi:unnamed protein product [Malassezia sympodialis ATCC 42132]|uniref:uncharacterized protein n=1 Tax=Malassezia sympodialis (strain ATCC 42132) TaxID=1230383 RepID=UPI0002C22EF8|nr:uncharacterized protein MSY001_0773 [Malassezia sympodialis ATCC 42132]CCU98067.1 unnamed protein product [Malassezia sympodialis ATCC 42132]|eukprot:XP_018739389.1 uncharacterized protein MSY001_0773 [Malassezia sympodialis ATCC 42132]